MRLARIEGQGKTSQPGTPVGYDFVCTATGYNAAGNLVWYAGGSFSYDDASAMHKIASLPEDMLAAGSLNEAYQLNAVMVDGKHTGWQPCMDVYGPRPIATGWLDQNDGHNC